MTGKHLLYMVYNKENETHHSLVTEFLQLNTNVDITAIRNNQQFQSGKYNIIEILPIEGRYDEANLESFINLCVAHTNYMEATAFVKFFYSLVNLFQYPKEQSFANLIGFFGELIFLQYVSEVLDMDLSDRWHLSSSTDKYDISLDSCNLEIKTTSAGNELITIKHAQLFNKDKNYLVAVLIEENNKGITLKALLDEMQNHAKHFKSLKFALNIEKEKKRISPIDAETKKFILRDVTIYAAEEINPFPNIPDNVSSISYRLDLSEASAINIETLKKEIQSVLS